jgi:aminoglycoside phosphotransferase (APT) family kinase protein
VIVAGSLRSHPEHGWLAAVLPDGARRIRVVGDDELAASLAAAGVDVSGTDPEVAIGPVDRTVGDAPLALVPVAALGPLRGPVPARLARRGAAALAVRGRARRARRHLARLYPLTAVVRWDVQQAVRVARASETSGSRPLVERLPRAAVVIGRRTEVAPTVYEAAVRQAGEVTGHPLPAGEPLVTGGGTLIALAGEHVVRVAVGPGRQQLERQHAALVALRARRPPQVVLNRLPRPLATGDHALGAWSLEERLPGAVPATVDAALRDECVDFLVALHGCRARGSAVCGDGARGAGASLARAADVVNALSGARRDGLRPLAERLDAELAGLPRGFTHGDFWRRNLLAEGGRLVGVVDWEHAGGSGLPLLDLLQLTATPPRDEGRSTTWVVTNRLLPWAHAGGDGTTRRYAERVGFELTAPLLERLVLAFWLDRLAHQLEKCGDRGGSPAWAAANVDPVLAAAGSGWASR